MTQLIVALDVPFARAIHLVGELRYSADVRFFKLGVANLLDENVHGLIRAIVNHPMPGWESELMLDLKLRDTPDTIRRVTRAAFSLGARFVTVDHTCAVVAHGERLTMGLPGDRRVLAVGALTSRLDDTSVTGVAMACGGAVAPAGDLAGELGHARSHNPDLTIVMPGVRLTGDDGYDHDPRTVVTPAQARVLGADYVVVGRPITDAVDPVAAARVYLKDLE